MTTISGLGHTIVQSRSGCLGQRIWIATVIACAVVFFELWAIAYIRARYIDTPFLQAVFRIVLEGASLLGIG